MEYSIGQKIAELRKQHSMTQEALAEAMGVSAQAVSKWENGLSCPDIMSLRPMAELFGVTVDELLSPDAVNRAVVLPESERKDVDDMMLRIHIIDNDDGDKVKLNIPILLIKALMNEEGKLSEGCNINFGNNNLANIDFQSIINAASKGTVGKLLEVETGDGSTIDIYIE